MDRQRLQDALGLLPEDMILEAKQVRKYGRWWLYAAAAACLALVVGLAIWSITDAPGINQTTVYTPVIAENLWQREGFQAVSLTYSAPYLQKTASADGFRVVLLGETGTQGLISTPLEVEMEQTIKLEALIARRYAAYYDERGLPAFYDLVEHKQVDLMEKVTGGAGISSEPLLEQVEDWARQNNPGMLDTENNLMLFRYSVQGYIDNLPAADYDQLEPDTDFLKAEYPYDDAQARKHRFFSLCWDAFVQGTSLYQDMYAGEPYRIEVYGVDPVNGGCIVGIRDILGNGIGFYRYDFQQDVAKRLPSDRYHALIGTMLQNGMRFRFSQDGSIATVATPMPGAAGANLFADIYRQNEYPSIDRHVTEYRGERIGIFCFDRNISYLLDVYGASEAFISPQNRIIYYRRMPAAAQEKSFLCSDSVWYDRLRLREREDDHWVFALLPDGDELCDTVTLPGTFVRFLSEEKAVLMVQNGQYRVYALETGEDITQAAATNQIPMMAHERLLVTHRDGWLYSRDVLTDAEAVQLIRADQYLLSDDGAFAFAYIQGESCVTCINVASLETYRIEMDDSFSAQIFQRPDAVLQMNYRQYDNALTLSYYIPEDLGQTLDSGVDFYALLEELGTAEPTTYEDIQVAEEIVEAVRASAHWIWDSHMNSEEKYPLNLTQSESLESALAKLGIQLPEGYLGVNGCTLVLHQSDTEKLELVFCDGWLLNDFSGSWSGMTLVYTENGKTCKFTL